MESWLTIEGFDEPLILSKLEAMHKVGIESTYKAHWEEKDPRSINNTTRPSDYALAGSSQPAMLYVKFMDKYDRRQELEEDCPVAVWVREIIHSMFYPR